MAANGGLLSYNVKFKVDISGRIWEELGVCWEDGATVKINGVMGLKTLEWVSDEVAADIGNYDFWISGKSLENLGETWENVGKILGKISGKILGKSLGNLGEI